MKRKCMYSKGSDTRLSKLVMKLCFSESGGCKIIESGKMLALGLVGSGWEVFKGVMSEKAMALGGGMGRNEEGYALRT
jgi:hypothetical protein